MSTKDLFERNYLPDKTEKTAYSEIESADNLKALSGKQKAFVPQVDYTDPQSFAKYGSAYLYYESALQRIMDFYPYDGSAAEINNFYNKSLDIEKYIFNSRYPRTNGYVVLSVDGWGTGTKSNDNYGLPAAAEYITFKGGPNVKSQTGNLKDIIPDPSNSKFQYNNVYDENLYTNDGLPSDYGKGTRTSNLKSDFDTGVTVEFWSKTGSLATSISEKQVVFDAWNNALSSSADYGRITIELNATASNSPWLITVQSGATSVFQQTVGTNVTLNSLEDWKHYAFTLSNTGSDFQIELYVDGELDDTETISSTTINELNPRNMVGRIGGLLTAPSGSADATLVDNYIGGGKLSGSMDEFRFWKVRRTAKDIGKNWFTQVRGGANTDIANTTLGLYYKFNEGITATSSIDSVVLDYGGRICNGTWTGYGSNSRNTGSAIVSASAAASEYLDPIIYSNHTDVASLRTELLNLGTYHDGQNTSRFLNLIPSWVIEETAEDDNSDLEKLSHIIGAYFDKIYLQISALPKFKHLNYPSSSHTPLPFSEHLPASLGLLTPEIFIDSTVTEKFANRTDTTIFEQDLQETKNLIYQNIYNNIASIYKSKGTERSIRNVLRCFNIDDNLIYLNAYANNQTYELQNNLVQTQKRKRQLNFNESTSTSAVVFQANDPAFSGETLGYISGSGTEGLEDKYGFTLEASTMFPKFFRSIDKVDRSFTEISLFGMQTVNSSSTENTAFLSGAQDTANFQVFAVRDAVQSKNVYFKLTSSIDPHPFDALTSSLFYDVYDNENWNFSVAVKPSNFPYADVVSGSSNYTYDVVFRGYNNKLGTINNQFEVSSSVSKAVGQAMLRAGKRVYVGARNTNITGSNLTKSDVLFNSAKYWTKFIDSYTLKQHALDRENHGISGSYRNINALDSLTSNQNSYNFNTLAMNWYFNNVTSSDGSGNFFVTDLSSGSANIRDNFGWSGKIAGYMYTGKGTGFLADSTAVAPQKIVSEFKFVDPEQVVSSDMVKILSEDDELFGLFDEVPNYVFTIEKSIYKAISEEILDFFAGVIDFNNVIGDPVHRYRMEYKPINHLRNIFFQRFSNINTVEKFTEYFKWFDDALANIIEQLVPASADIVPDVYNTIESHVLERNKYQTPFPTIEFKDTLPGESTPGRASPGGTFVPSTTGIIALTRRYELDAFGGVESSPRPTNLHKNFWKKKARPGAAGVGDFEISSGDATVDAARTKLRDVMWKKPVLSGTMPTLSTVAGVKYQKNIAIVSLDAGTVDLKKVDIDKTIKGGVNFEHNKSIDYTYSSLRPAGPINTNNGVFVPQNVLFAETIDLEPIDTLAQWNQEGNVGKKRKRHLKVIQGRDYVDGQGYAVNKNSFSFPFNVMSASIPGGVDKLIRARTEDNLTITNLHNDVYGPEMEHPMQGPFTNYAVGGHQSRHVPLNKSATGKSALQLPYYNGLDDYTTRPEAWKILIGKCSGIEMGSGAIGMVAPDYPWPEANDRGVPAYPLTASQKAYLYRDHIAKRPVNIRNIRMRTGSTILGNFERNYEVVHSFDAYANPRNFIENQPVLPTVIFSNKTTASTQTRTFLDLRRNADGHFQFVSDYNVGYLSGTINKSIITTRFAAPGGIEVSTHGYRDFRASEFSVYNSLNHRNSTVIRRQQTPSGATSEPTGIGTPGIRVFDIHGRDFGLTSHYARHTAKFGRDSNLVTDAEAGSSYIQSPGFHKTHRNNLDRVEITGYDGPNFTHATQSQYDNFFVSHQIPRSTKQYSWITKSVVNTNDVIGFTMPDFTRRISSSTGITYEDSYDFVSASQVGSSYFTAVLALGRTFGRAQDQAGFEQFIPQVSRLNLNIVDPLSASTNTMGHATTIPLGSTTETDTQYINVPELIDGATAVGTIPDAFNMLMIKRNGYYGNAGWQQARRQDHQLLMHERRNNKLSVQYRNGDLQKFDLFPVSAKGRPVRVNLDYINMVSTSAGGIQRTPENITFKTSYNNEMVLFQEQKLNDFVEVNFDSEVTAFEQLVAMKDRNNIQLNWILYSENVFPSTRNEFRTQTSERTNYDNLFWRDTQADRIALGVGRANSLGTTGSADSNSSAANFTESLLSQSVWPLDAPSDFETRTAPPVVTIERGSTGLPTSDDIELASLVVSNSAGELQNTYSTYTFANSSSVHSFNLGQTDSLAVTIRNSALYARKHMMNSPLSVRPDASIRNINGINVETLLSYKIPTGSGEAKWEAATQAGYLTTSNGVTSFVSSESKPFYNNYDSFKQDIKSLAKGYAVVPEFRVSEQIENYTKFGIQDGENFDTFEIPGTELSSSQDTFYKDFSNSDFLRNFADIKKMSDLSAKEIKLTCHAAIKFNPYKGFYPAQRSLDLVSQFSKSYGDSVEVLLNTGKSDNPIDSLREFSDGTQDGRQPIHSALARSVIKPLFAPGILYNSIKSGMAVDYPISTNGYKFISVNVTGALLFNPTENHMLTTSDATGSQQYVSGAFWDVRLPFETIIDPSKTMRGLVVPEQEPHPSQSFGSGARPLAPSSSIASSPADKLYSMMASNYFAEVGKFFLKEGGYTRLQSNGVSLSTFKFGRNEVYGARLRMKTSFSGSRTYSYESGSDGSFGFFATDGARAVFKNSDTSISSVDIQRSGTFEIPQDPTMNPRFIKNFTMYDRASGFGPPVAGREFGSVSKANNNGTSDLFALSASAFGVKDSMNGHNWSFTPPYYDGEAWVDFIFRPSASVEYDLQRILAETQIVKRRFDPGPDLPGHKAQPGVYRRTLIRDNDLSSSVSGALIASQNFTPYASENINHNAMQIDSAVNLFGVENITKRQLDKFGNEILSENSVVGQRWVIQPKFETPMMNFYDASKATAGFGDEATPKGMWHQFGRLPSTTSEGIFLEIDDIPAQWLTNHYEVVTGSSIYNNYTAADGSKISQQMKSFSSLMGFSDDNSKVRLGQLAEKQTIKEAIVAVPYIVEGIPANGTQPSNSNAKTRKQFINIPRKRFDAAKKSNIGSKSGDSLDAAGNSIRKLIQKMDDYILPPQFDFVNNDIDPMVMYVFEFKYELDKNDLSYVWQNLAPREYTKMEFQQDSVAHELINTELLTEKNLLSNPNLRWMIFKVKQRSQASYSDMTVAQVGQTTKQKLGDTVEMDGYNLSYNWPYDYVSIVESIKTDVDVVYKREAGRSNVIEPKPTTGKQNTTLSKKSRRKKKVSLKEKKNRRGN